MARNTTARTGRVSGKPKLSIGRSAATENAKTARARIRSGPGRGAIHDVLSLAEEQGLLAGARTLVVRGRMPMQLVAAARRKTGITSDTKLLEAALANIVLSDDYADWLLAQRGGISPELDLEF